MGRFTFVKRPVSNLRERADSPVTAAGACGQERFEPVPGILTGLVNR